jgi:hypothetical protein
MQFFIDLALGRDKRASLDLRFKAGVAIHERGYGKPAQNISVDVALKRAIEDKDPDTQLRLLQDMRAAYLAAPPPPIVAEVLEAEEAEAQSVISRTTSASCDFCCSCSSFGRAVPVPALRPPGFRGRYCRIGFVELP